MTIDNFTLLAKFIEYNNAYFSGLLPIPQFKLMHGCQTLGYFSDQYDEYNNANEMIQMTDFYDYTESQFRNVMVHEMIHYYHII